MMSANCCAYSSASGPIRKNKSMSHKQKNFRGIDVGIQITTNQVTTMAPDSASASAGKKLSNLKNWKNVGQNAEVVWGECQGSALYQVRLVLSTFTTLCSCPSRKQPCKHCLGLLFLAASSPDAIPETDPPQWIIDWMAKRAATAQRKEAKETASDKKTTSASSAKTAQKRQAQVQKGIEQLDLWLNDLVRNGLGTLETQPSTFWEKQAAQMVDAQAPGLATSIRLLATIPNASANWPEKLLAQLGKLALLTHAYQRLDQLEPAMQESIRQLIGWNVKEDEVIAQGEHFTDTWLITGQVIDESDRGKTQRVWLLGKESRRTAYFQQFTPTNIPFSHHYPFGLQQPLELAYWTGVQAQRALLIEHKGEYTSWSEDHLPGHATIEAFFDEVTTLLATFPWRERFLCSLCNVTPFYDQESQRWSIIDQQHQSLPLRQGEHWLLFALAGGVPVDFVGEWNGEILTPIGALVNGSYHLL